MDQPVFSDPRIAIGAAPIDGGAGGDVRADPEFESLEATVRRMDTEGPGAVRWQEVARDGLAILGTKGKDLLVAVWTAFALSRTEGVAGFAVGIGIIEGLVGEHWETMQPPARRERARVGAMEWLVGRLATTAADWPNPPAGYPAMLGAYQSLDAVDRMLSEKLTKEQASLGELIRALRPKADEARRALAEAAAKATAPAEPPPPPAPSVAAVPASAPNSPTPTVEPQPPAAPSPAPSPAPASVAAVATPAAVPTAVGADLNRSISQLTDAIRAHALALRQSDLTDPRGYILTRKGAWLAVRQAPPAQSGKSAVPPPDPARLAAIDAMQTGGRHAEAVAATESLVAQSPFFVDGNLLVARSLGSLGGDYAKARLAVVSETAAYLLRLPELRDIAFSDGRRFVSDAVIAWLADEGGLGGGPAGGDDPVATLLAEARQRTHAGSQRDGIAFLSQASANSGGGRQRLRIQLVQAQFLIEADLLVAAWALLDHVDAEIVRRELEEWEPDCAALAAELRLRIGTAQMLIKAVPDDRRRVALESARQRLVRCDVDAAARLIS